MISIGTDFSGIGSPEQALIKLGVKHISNFACDYDKYAKQSYLANYKPKIFYDDITKRDHKQTPYVDLYVAGFPCQAFSTAGKRKGFQDTRGTLFFDLLQYLKEQKPKYFILENVKGLLSHDKGRTFGTILDCLAKTVNKQYFITPPENLGYHVYYKVLNTKDYGVPQNRERVFIVGFRDDKHKFKFPKKIPLKLKLKDIIDYDVDDKYYLSEKMIKGIEKSNSKRIKVYGADTPCFKVHSLYPRSGDPKKGGTGHLSKQDGTTYCIDTGNCQAIECVNGAGVKIQNKIRRLTPLECFRLQGFPDSFYYKCKEDGLSDTQLYKQAGNSMTVDVMAYLIKEILENEKTH